MSQFLSAVPEIVLYGCVVIAVACLGTLVTLFVQVGRVKSPMKMLQAAIEASSAGSGNEGRNGLTLERLDGIRSQCESLPDLPRRWWSMLDSRIEAYSSPEDVEGWFLTASARDSLSYETTVGKRFHAAIFSAFPGLLTGAGLTLTFVAILLALYGVHYDKANTIEPISGIDGLINGLSGKFLSSIVALLLSIVFTIFEKREFRRLRNCYEQLIGAIEAAIPVLSSSRILLDIRRYTHDQTVSISHISSDVVDRFIGAFNTGVVPALASGMAEKLQTEFRPTMQQMSVTLESLETAIVRLESQKQESVTGEIRALLGSLETSLVSSLSKMGDDFHQALTGAANKEFGNVQGTLESTRQMLSEMNAQFGAMQTAFTTIIEKAEQSTSDQMRIGREQTEALTGLMNGLMMRMQESADQNLGTVRAQLTLVVSDLAERVGALSREMMTAADHAATRAQESASAILSQSGVWSEATARKLDALLSNMEVRSTEFQQAAKTLLDAKGLLTNVIAENSTALGRMAEASKQVQTYTTALAGHGESLKDLGKLQSQVTSQLREVSGSIKATHDENQQLLAEYRRSFTEYKGVIDELDANLGKILATLQSGLQDYNQSIENNFREVVKIANPMISEASSYLQTQIEELSGQFEELGSILSKTMGNGNGRAR
jgi:ElaB/YqjD/DUF883 family membrane-anchored ribosome-binding protein